MATVAASCLFLAAMIHAAVTDLRRHRFLNKTIIALAVAYLPLAYFAGLGWVIIISSIVAAVLIFVIGFAGFCVGWFGGGDVKLAGIAGLWIGAELVVPFLLLSAVFGLVLMVLITTFHRWQRGEAPQNREALYGPGIVLAALALFPVSQWFSGG